MEFVHLDKQRRMVLPKKIWEELGSDDLAIGKQEERFVLIPVKSFRELVGIMPNIDMAAHKREHAKER